MLLFLFLFLFVICTPGLAVAVVAAVIPRQLIKLYVNWYIILSLLFYAWTIQQPSFSNKRFSGMDDEVFWLNIAVSATAIAIRLMQMNIATTKGNDAFVTHQNDEYTDILKELYYLTAIAYGCIAVYFIYLFYGDFFAGYRPAYLAYIQAFIFILLMFALAKFLLYRVLKNQSTILKKCIELFAYSLCGAICALLIYSIKTPTVVVKATNSTIQNNHQYIVNESVLELKYCIQTVGRRTRTSSITTKLDLSPLIMYSKAELGSAWGWGKPYYHALLVVDKRESIYLYNWSYKERKWSILEPGFAEKASIEQPEIVCTPQRNYLATVPWIFPRR